MKKASICFAGFLLILGLLLPAALIAAGNNVALATVPKNPPNPLASNIKEPKNLTNNDPAWPDITLFSRPGAETTAPGESVSILNEVSNIGNTPTQPNSPIVVNFKAPSGFQFVGSTNLGTVQSTKSGTLSVTGGFNCSVAGSTKNSQSNSSQTKNSGSGNSGSGNSNGQSNSVQCVYSQFNGGGASPTSSSISQLANLGNLTSLSPNTSSDFMVTFNVPTGFKFSDKNQQTNGVIETINSTINQPKSSLTGATGSSQNQSSVFRIVKSYNSATIIPELGGDAQAQNGQTVTEDFSFLNVGPSAAYFSPSTPLSSNNSTTTQNSETTKAATGKSTGTLNSVGSINLNGLLYPNLATNVTFSGANWNCGSGTSVPHLASPSFLANPSGSFNCSYLAELPVGQISSTLQLSYRLTDNADKNIGQNGITKTWNTTVSSIAVSNNIQSSVNGSPGTGSTTGQPNTSSQSSSFQQRLLVLPPNTSQLVTTATFLNQLDQVVQGSVAALQFKVANSGLAPTTGTITTTISVPKGISITVASPTNTSPAQQNLFSCQSESAGKGKSSSSQYLCSYSGPSLNSGTSFNQILILNIGKNTAVGDDVLSLSSSVQNQSTSEPYASTTVPIFIIASNVGIPELGFSRYVDSYTPEASSQTANKSNLPGSQTKSTSGKNNVLADPNFLKLGANVTGQLSPVTDGSPTSLETGQALVEGFSITNIGQGNLEKGSEFNFSESIPTWIKVIGTKGLNGFKCSYSKQVVTCNGVLNSQIAPKSSSLITEIELTPQKATKSYSLTAKLLPHTTSSLSTSSQAKQSGTKGSNSLDVKYLTYPVTLKVKSSAPNLAPDFQLTSNGTAGGIGKVELTVNNSGINPATGKINIALSYSDGVTYVRYKGKGWSCKLIKKYNFNCVYNGTVLGSNSPNQNSTPVTLYLFYSNYTSHRSLNLKGTVTGKFKSGDSSASIQIIPRSKLIPTITSSGTTLLDDNPLTKSNETPVPYAFSLQGGDSSHSYEAITYQWSQICTSKSELNKYKICDNTVDPKVTWLNTSGKNVPPQVQDATFIPPTVKSNYKLEFKLIISDGSARATTYKTIYLISDATKKQSFNFGSSNRQKFSFKSTKSTDKSSTLPNVHKSSLIQSTVSSVSNMSQGPLTGSEIANAIHSFKFQNSGFNPLVEIANILNLSADGSNFLALKTPAPNYEVQSVKSKVVTSYPPKVTYSASNIGSNNILPMANTSTSGSTVFCQIFDQVINKAASAVATVNLPGSIVLDLGHITVSGSACDSSTQISFNQASLKIPNIVTFSALSGTINSEGILITAGQADLSALPNTHFMISTASGTSNSGSSQTSTGQINPQGFFIGFPGGSNSSSNTQLSVTGNITASSFAFLPLPNSGNWQVNTEVSFSIGTGTNSITLSSTAVGLTTSNSGTPRASVSGTISSDGSFSMSASATDLIQIQQVGINLSGSISRSSATSPITFSISGSIASPISLIPGLSLNTLSVNWSPNGGKAGISGSGSIVVGIGSNSTQIDVNFSYDSLKDWSFSASSSSTTQFEPLPGLIIQPKNITGSISSVNGTLAYSLSAKSTGTWSPVSGVGISDISINLSNTCTESSGYKCPSNTSLFIDLSGNLTLSVPGSQTINATVSGAIGLPSGAFSLGATIQNSIDITSGVSLNNLHAYITSGMNAPDSTAGFENNTKGLNVTLVGSAKLPIFGQLPTVNLNFSSSGFSIWSNLGSYSLPGSSNSKLSNTILAFSTYSTKLNIFDSNGSLLSQIPVSSNTFIISGGFDTPSWVKTLLGLPGNINGQAVGSVNLSNGNFSLKVSLNLTGDWYLYGDAASATNVQLNSIYLEVELNNGDFSVALGGTATLNIAGTSSSNASSIQLGVNLSFTATTQTIAGSLTLSSQNGWNDAFGVSGLTVYGMAVSVNFSLTTLTPSIGLAASATLPSDIRDPLGMSANTVTTVVANISLTNPCFGLEINDPTDPNANVLNIKNADVFTAKSLNIEIAPSGCTVGQFTYSPGISLNFNGSILGVPVTVDASLGINPFALDAHLTIGEISYGGVNFDKTEIGISISPTSFSLNFSGGLSALGVTVSASGYISVTPTSQVLDLSGTLDGVNLGSVLSINGVSLKIHVETGTTNSASFQLKGDVGLLGSTVYADISLSVANGTLSEAKALIIANINIAGAVGLNGTFDLNYGPNIPFSLNASVSLSVGGYTIVGGSANVNSTSFSFSGRFDLAGIFTADVTGQFYGGSVSSTDKIQGPNGKVQAQTGDFYLSATNISVNLGGISALANVSIGRAAGSAWANFDATVSLLGTQSNNSVSVSGAIQGNGNFTLSGQANLDLVGFVANVSVNVARSGVSVAITASANISLLGVTVNFNGSFSTGQPTPYFPSVLGYSLQKYFNKIPQATGSTVYYSLNGSASVNVGGYNLGNASFSASNYPGSSGFYASISFQVGSVVNLSGKMTILPDSRFYFNINANLNLVVLNASADITFTNCTNASCSTRANATTLKAVSTVNASGFSFGVSVFISSNGTFLASARSPVSGVFSGDTGSLYLIVVAFYANITYNMTITISSNYPYVAVNGAGRATVYGKSWGCHGWFECGWGNWSPIVGVAASISTNPFRACGYVNVWGKDFGGCIG